MSVDLSGLDEANLAEWLAGQRWFGAKSRELAQVRVLDVVVLREDPALRLAVAVVEARFPGGTHDLYQLPLAIRPASEAWSTAVLEQLGGHTVYDALSDPEAAALIAGMLRDRAVRGGGPAHRVPLGRRRPAAGRAAGRPRDGCRAVELVGRHR